mmetsp:Transcript_9231/g.19376  ORF Transcript_9231/g.19376 Transcript_9231/m.19376 type:complete len:95 (-) Transcript_9231:291-575(-)
MIPIQSFLIGSLTSGLAFLFVHRELSHRGRLTRKWPQAEIAENELRALAKSMKSQLEFQKVAAGADPAFLRTETVTKNYKQLLERAYSFFEKKD